MSVDKLKAFLFPGSGHNELTAGEQTKPAYGMPNFGRQDTWQQLLLQLKDVPYPAWEQQLGNALVLRPSKIEPAGDEATEVMYSVSWEYRLDKLYYIAADPIKVTGEGTETDPLQIGLELTDDQRNTLEIVNGGLFTKARDWHEIIATKPDIFDSGFNSPVANMAGSVSVGPGAITTREDEFSVGKAGGTKLVANVSEPKISTDAANKAYVDEGDKISPDPNNALIRPEDGYLVPNSTIKWDNETKVITFKDNKGNEKDIDLSQFVSDIHIENATFDPETSILTLHVKDEDGTEMPDITIDLGELSKTKIEQSPTVQLSGNGSGVTPLRADVNISAAAGNTMEARADGLYVNVPDLPPLPIASETVLGAIKVGENLTIESDGTLNAEASGDIGDLETRLTAAESSIQAKVDKTLSIIAGRGLTGGGTLEASRQLDIADAQIPAAATLLAAGRNLNDVQAPGFYYQNANANATTPLNYPINQAGSLVVTLAAGVIQEYTGYHSGRKFYRGYYSGTWGAWVSVYSSNFPPAIAWGNITGIPATASRWPTWAEVSGKPAIPVAPQTQAAGAVGTYALVTRNYAGGISGVSWNGTIAGSLIKPSSSGDTTFIGTNQSQAGIAGTWRAMGEAITNQRGNRTSLALRIA